MADYWTISALNTKDGIGKPDFSTTYTMPVGQNGCKSATHCYDEAGAAASAAAFTSEVVTYNIDSNGVVELNHSHTARTNNGVNAALMYWYAPLKCSGANDVYVGSVRSYQNSVHFSGFICMSLENSFSFSYVTTTDNAVSVNSSGFNSGDDNFYGIIRYRAF